MFGKPQAALSLQELARTAHDYHIFSNEGMDVLKAGDGLGVGGFGCLVDGKVALVRDAKYRFRVLADGPLRAVCECKYLDWNTTGATMDLTARMSIFAGQKWAECRLTAVSRDGRPVPDLVAGIVKHVDGTEAIRDQKAVSVGRWGNQALGDGQRPAGGNLGIGVVAGNDVVAGIGEDESSDFLRFKPGLKSITYRYAGSWYREPDPAKSSQDFARLLADTGAMKPVVHWIDDRLTTSPASAILKPIYDPAGRPPAYGRDTDVSSLRHTALSGNDPASTEILRKDVNGDGKPDILESWWHGKRARWFDLNSNMIISDVLGDRVGDTVQIDRDGDGYYDGPDDLNVRWIDESGGGRADFMIMVENPSATQSRDSGKIMLMPDTDGDNVDVYIDWSKVTYDSYITKNSVNKRPGEHRSSYYQDWNGDSLFLWTLAAPGNIEDMRALWENPFCFYDMDGDGCSELSVRIVDEPQFRKPPHRSRLRADLVHVSYDLDNDTNRSNEADYDMTFRMQRGEELDFSSYANNHPKLRAPDWMLPYFRYDNWLKIEKLYYVPHDKAYETVFKPKWGSVALTFDEDDDDHRWERVESYFSGDPYNLARWGHVAKDGDTTRSMSGHAQADSVGDRGEFDEDYSGRGQLYVGKWDKKIHLLGAESGAWTIDDGAMYWGSSPVTGDSSPESAKQVGAVVLYRDTDNDGYIDEISYDDNGDRRPELSISLLELRDEKTSGAPAVEAALINPAAAKWEGMHGLYARLAEESWQDAHLLYNAVWKKGLLDRDLDELANACSVAEKSDHAYWIKQKIFRKLDTILIQRGSADLTKRKHLHKLFFTGHIAELVSMIENTDWR
jgi:hypothetical protein